MKMTLTWGVYVAISLAIFIFLLQNELDIFTEQSHLVSLRWTDVNTTENRESATSHRKEMLSELLAAKLSPQPRQTQGREQSPWNPVSGPAVDTGSSCFLATTADQYVLTVVHPSEMVGPPHDPRRGVVKRYVRPMSEGLNSPPSGEWALVWTDQVGGSIVGAKQDEISGHILVAYQAVHHNTATTRMRHFDPFQNEQSASTLDYSVPGSLGVSALSIRRPDHVSMYAHFQGFHHFHIASPVGPSWGWRSGNGCGDEVCVVDGPLADRRSAVSHTTNIISVPDPIDGKPAALSVSIDSDSHRGSSAKLSFLYHTTNSSAGSRCSCRESDMMVTHVAAELEATLTASIPKNRPIRSSYTQCPGCNFTVVSVADLVLLVQQEPSSYKFNVTQLLSQDISSPVKFMMSSEDGDTLLVVMTDNRILLVWRNPSAPPMLPPEPLDTLTAIAYEAVMLDNDIPYEPLGGSPWNSYVVIQPPPEMEQLAVASAAVVSSGNDGSDRWPSVLVVYEGGLLSVYQVSHESGQQTADSVMFDFITSVLSIATIGIVVMICGGNLWVSAELLPQPGIPAPH
eukprot:TRINITY_DN2490_c0_g1_i1.p1 TRINITY_DN2490_c0_g1~~TRINITY_DN2490_c0_g1_i1.p1  ORF type:complete len:569 (-),score=88.67 TRINITY_DN2490_c0_g1_i1:302-2008(-)